MTSTISEMNKKGDELLLEWDEKDEKQHKTVKAAVSRLIKKGALLFKVENHDVKIGNQLVSSGKKRGTQITEQDFDPSKKQKLLAARPLQGG